MDKELVGKCLLDEKEIGKAITNAECEWHGITPEFAEANPDYLCPDGGWNELDSTPLWFFNRAISKAATVKAIPIIQKAERERIHTLLIDNIIEQGTRQFRTIVNSPEFLNALKGETNDG